MKTNDWCSLKTILFVLLVTFVNNTIMYNFLHKTNWLLLSIACSLGSLLGILLTIELSSSTQKIWLNLLMGTILLAIVFALFTFTIYLCSLALTNYQTISEILSKIFYFLFCWFYASSIFCYFKKRKRN